MQPPLLIYRLSHVFYRLKLIPLCWILDYTNRLIFRCWIPGSAKIGKKCSVGYWGIGVIIHSHAVIGDYCQIGQHVTIGRKFTEAGVPTIGNHVYIGAHSVVYGNITIGDHAIIGSMSLVNKPVEAHTFVGGIPAKKIKDLD